LSVLEGRHDLVLGNREAGEARHLAHIFGGE
jgi:hypothetical protein